MNKKVQESTIKVEELRLPVTEAQDTLRALRRGEIDALIVKGKSGEQVLALYDADQPYRVLVEKMQDGAATLDKDGAVLYCNDRLASLLHTSTKRLISTSIYRWVAPEDQAQLRMLIGDGAMQQARDVTLCAASGEFLQARVTVTSVSLQGIPGCCISVSDITVLKRTERTLALVEELAAVLANTQELDTALDTILCKMGEAGGWSWAEAWLLRADRVGLECNRRWKAENSDSASQDHKNLVCLRGMGLVGRAWAESRALWAQEAWQNRDGNSHRPSLKTGMAIPIFAAGEVAAVIAFYIARPRAEDADLLKLTQTVTAQLGPFILNKTTASTEALLAAIMQSTEEAIIGQDLNGLIMHWSAGAQRLYGYAPVEIIGRPFSLLVPPELAREAEAGLQQAEGNAGRIKTVHLNKARQKISVSVLAAPVCMANGRRTGTVVFARAL